MFREQDQILTSLLNELSSVSPVQLAVIKKHLNDFTETGTVKGYLASIRETQDRVACDTLLRHFKVAGMPDFFYFSIIVNVEKLNADIVRDIRENKITAEIAKGGVTGEVKIVNNTPVSEYVVKRETLHPSVSDEEIVAVWKDKMVSMLARKNVVIQDVYLNITVLREIMLAPGLHEVIDNYVKQTWDPVYKAALGIVTAQDLNSKLAKKRVSVEQSPVQEPAKAELVISREEDPGVPVIISSPTLKSSSSHRVNEGLQVTPPDSTSSSPRTEPSSPGRASKTNRQSFVKQLSLSRLKDSLLASPGSQRKDTNPANKPSSP